MATGARDRELRDRAEAAPGTIQIGVVATSTTAASTPRGRGRVRAGGPAGRAATGGAAAVHPVRGLVEGVEVRVDRRGGQQLLVAADGADRPPSRKTIWSASVTVAGCGR